MKESFTKRWGGSPCRTTCDIISLIANNCTNHQGQHVPKPPKLTHSSIRADNAYIELMHEIGRLLENAQLRAAILVNRELLLFYWQLGKLIIEKQKGATWGDKIFDTLAQDMAKNFPATKGFSETNLRNMKNFAIHYPHAEFTKELPDQLTWTHHVVLIQLIKLEMMEAKQWYAFKTVENGWGYRQLKEQIQSSLYERQGHGAIKTTNFHDKLPSPQSSLAHEMIKEPYKFHFLSVGKNAHEKDVQIGLMSHVKEFLMELGQGFALYGSNYPIHVSGKRFEIDLLMYNTKLHCYFVIELKRGDFQPEHTGQLNFYLSAIDDILKTENDGPTIGLLLCESKDRVIAEYALRRVESPMGIAEYELSKSLPPLLYKVLPTTDEIEAELSEYASDHTTKQENNK